MSESEEYPGINEAYQFVEPSYEWMLQRLEAANRRIQRLMGFSATVTFAAPVLGQAVNSNIDFTSCWFYLALGMFVVVMGLNSYAMVSGTVQLLSPKKLYNDNEYVKVAGWEFRKNVLYTALEAYEHNGDLVEAKGNIAISQSMALTVQVIAFGIWILV